MRAPSKQELIKALSDAKILARKDLVEFGRRAKSEGKSFEEILLLTGAITADRLSEIKAKIVGIPPSDLTGFIDPSLAALLPVDAARRMGILPLRKDGKRLVVAMSDPWDLEALEFLQKKTGMETIVEYAPKQDIGALLAETEKLGLEMSNLFNDQSQLADKESEIIRIIDALIHQAIRLKASDIHIELQEADLVVRYRIDGVLRDIVTFPKSRAPAILARIKVLASLKLDEHRLPQDGRFMMHIDGRRFSFRASIIPIFDGEKAELRILEEDARAFTLEELGFTRDQQEKIRRSIGLPFGMILATGPTGSGKTTTLYTLLRMLNKREVNIVTAEDPVEYRLEGVNQTQVRPEIGFTFANALRSLLRQDPNIIMVGEIRDNETARLAVNAALTGHLVLSTLHTNDAPGTLPRLLDMGVEAFLIASTVRLIIAQRLVRRLCDTIKIQYRLSDNEYRELQKVVDVSNIEMALRQEGVLGEGQSLMDLPWYRPGALADCPDGYRGRVSVSEVLEVTESIRQLIFRGANADEIRHIAKSEGMRTIQEVGFLAAARGVTSIEEILRATKE